MLNTSPIRFHRERTRMTQEELASLSGITVKYLDELERRAKPRLTTRLRAMSHILQVPVEELRS
jgi:transcriptional regulator with XRE-family HTH domain